MTNEIPAALLAKWEAEAYTSYGEGFVPELFAEGYMAACRKRWEEGGWTEEQIIAAAQEEIMESKFEGEEKKFSDGDYKYMGFLRSVINRLKTPTASDGWTSVEERQELNLTVSEEKKLFSDEVGYAIHDGQGNLICEIWEPVVNTGWAIRFTFGGSLKNQPTSEQAINAAKEYLKKCFLPRPTNDRTRRHKKALRGHPPPVG